MAIDDKLTRHQHYVERYKTGTANEVDAYIRRVDKLIRELLSGATLSTAGQLERLQRRIRVEILEIYREWARKFPNKLVDFGIAEAAFYDKAMEGVALAIPTRQALRSAIVSRPFNNKLLREELNDFTQSQIRLIKNAISTGFYEGQSNAEIIRAIRGTKANNFRDGILSIGKRKAERITRTAINHTASQARIELFKQNGIKEYVWVSVLDGRTSDICRGLDGNVYKVGKGKVPPAHPNCRSDIRAVP